jgi:hypothetical protein
MFVVVGVHAGEVNEEKVFFGYCGCFFFLKEFLVVIERVQ